jgi:hypothetical protein
MDILMKARRLVETVIGQLTERFHIEKVRARDTWHLTNRFTPNWAMSAQKLLKLKKSLS